MHTKPSSSSHPLKERRFMRLHPPFPENEHKGPKQSGMAPCASIIQTSSKNCNVWFVVNARCCAIAANALLQ